MSSERDIQRVLDRWFAERPPGIADRILGDVAHQIGHQRQRPAWLVLWRDSPRRTYLDSIAAIAAAVLVVVIGLVVLRTSPGTGVGGPSAPTASPTSSPALTQSPTSQASASVGVARACDLMTADEARSALHIPSPVTADILDFDLNVSATTFASPFCGFNSGGRSLFVLRYETGTGADAFDHWKSGTGAEAVSGLGDGAVWYPARTTLYIVKGDRLITVMPLGQADPTLTLQAAKAIGAIVVKRM